MSLLVIARFTPLRERVNNRAVTELRIDVQVASAQHLITGPRWGKLKTFRPLLTCSCSAAVRRRSRGAGLGSTPAQREWGGYGWILTLQLQNFDDLLRPLCLPTPDIARQE